MCHHALLLLLLIVLCIAAAVVLDEKAELLDHSVLACSVGNEIKTLMCIPTNALMYYTCSVTFNHCLMGL
jgi:hypothetical protein